jgi:4-amino-4-deoxy-L-arabinose transferase-like glycosyltransferase
MTFPDRMTQLRKMARHWPALWWAGIVALVGLHFVHLSADFPNFSPWMDYSKYTDEGWYANAAIRQTLFGHWRIPGDFNPGVALPVWPLLLRGVFAVSGVSLLAARMFSLTIFSANLLTSYFLLRRFASRPVALTGVTVLAGSAYLWAFSRLAILEPVVVLFLLLSWLLVFCLADLRATHNAAPGSPSHAIPEACLLLTIGLLLALAVLTKTTALFLVPATLCLLWHTTLHRTTRIRQGLIDTALVAVGGLVPWAAYYFLFVRPHYAVDYHYLFMANRWVQPTTASGWLWAFWYALHGTLWVDPTLCGIALAVLGLGFLGRPRLYQEPLVAASLLASAGYIFFTGWHNNPQPRYYEVVLFPLVFVVCLGAQALSRSSRRAVQGLGVLAWVAVAYTIAANVRGSLFFARHPEYTLLRAADGVTRYIDRHPNGNRLLLSISGDQITLMTHLPAICDDFGTVDLPYRIHTYQPGWYAAWNEIDPGTLEDLHTQFSLERVASFHAFDDEDRDELILYKLHPLAKAQRQYNTGEEAALNRGRE